MSERKANSISKDFPLYHSEHVPIFVSEKIIPKGKKIIPSNVYTNEHPDFFKLDYMVEKGYKNPYLDEVLKVDRSEELKKIENNVNNRLQVINFIKSNRKYSQDPKILKYIQSEFDVEMYRKRQRIIEEKKNKKVDSKTYLSTEPSDSNYMKYIRKLNGFNPRLHYQCKKYLDNTDNIPLGEFNISKDNFEKIKKIKCEIEPQKSSYIGNYNDYNISEAQTRNKNKEFNHMRKTFMKTSLISGRKEKINLPPERIDRWGSFYENYLLLLNNCNGLRKKGGLFTEFSNKNICSIIVNKNDIRERLKKQREQKEKEKEKERRMSNTLSNSLNSEK